MPNIRLWGGPACGQIHEWTGYDDRVRIMLRPKVSAQEVMEARNITIDTVDYERSSYTDSTGLRVFLFPGAGEWLIRHWNESVANYRMNQGRHSKVLVVPRGVWREAEIFIHREMGSVAQDIQSTIMGTAGFRGIKIMFGDKTEFLAEEPRRPLSYGFGQSTPPWTIQEREDSLHRQIYGEPPLVSPLSLGAQRLLDVLTEVVNVTGQRRNCNTIMSNPGQSGPSMMRIVIENGTKLEESKRDRLHKQFLQATRNWHLQYLENSDRI